MVAKTLLPLLLAASVVAAKDVSDLCSQFTDQFNKLQDLVPLELDVMFPLSGYLLSGHAKYRIVSPLTFGEDDCVTNVSGDVRTAQIKLQNQRAYIITTKKAYFLDKPSYELKLDVEESISGDTKNVTVAGFSFATSKIFDSTSEIAGYQKDNLVEHLRLSFLHKLQKKLNKNFQTEDRVEINSKLVRELMVNVFKVFAQDL